MIRVHMKLPTKGITDYNDKSAFEAFASLIDQMKQSGLSPTHFLGQVSPYLLFSRGLTLADSILIDSDGNKYSFQNGEHNDVTGCNGTWKKNGKILTMKERMDLPDTWPHPKRPECQIKNLKIYPGARGMPKSIDELAEAMTKANEGFDPTEISTYIPAEETVSWNGPLSNPQALACFTGTLQSTFSLYLGSHTCYLPDQPIPFSDRKGPALIYCPCDGMIKLELSIKTNFRDTVRGPGTVTYAERGGKILIDYPSYDIHLYPPEGCAFEDIQLVKSILKKGVPDREEVSSLEQSRPSTASRTSYAR